MLRLYKFMLYFGENKRPMEQPLWAESKEDAISSIPDLYSLYNYTWELLDD